MSHYIEMVLGCWVILSAAQFRLLPARSAAVVSLVGGWLILPTAAFETPAVPTEFPYWFMPAALPAQYLVTKAAAIGLGALLGVLLFDFHRLGRLRFSWCDLPVLLWCVVPLVSAVATGSSLTDALLAALYLLLAWGVPYLLGRLYLASWLDAQLWAVVLVLAGLALLPLCVLEFFFGPQVYALAYGYHPYAAVGAQRYVGFRPVLFFEDGNQLGLFLAVVALVASWLARSEAVTSIGRVRMAWMALALATACMICQSVGAIVLLGAGFISLLVLGRVGKRWPLALLLVLLLGYVGLRATGVVNVRALAERTPVGRKLIAWSVDAGRRSFGWRLNQEERHVRAALERPVLGHTSWDWWKNGVQRPWGLWLLAFGMYGVVGLAVLLAVVVAPLGVLLAQLPPRLWASPRAGPIVALAAALFIALLDSLLNAAFLLPLLAVAGGIATLAQTGQMRQIVNLAGVSADTATAEHGHCWPTGPR